MNEQGLTGPGWPESAPDADHSRHGSCDAQKRPLTKGKEAHMRDELNAPTRRLRGLDAKTTAEGRNLAEELIRKARLATAIHMALQAERRADGKQTS